MSVNDRGANIDELKQRFVEICASINRPGKAETTVWGKPLNCALWPS